MIRIWWEVVLHRYRMFIIEKAFRKTYKKNSEEILRLKEDIAKLEEKLR